MTDELAPLRRRYGPGDLAPLLLRANGVARTVLVQARTALAETRELLETGAPQRRGSSAWSAGSTSPTT